MEHEKYPHTILIVEDEASMADALADNLVAAGFKPPLRARDGEEAMHMALKETPDLILLDIVMSKMDGMTMLKRLRADPKGKELKVVLLTNLTADDSIMGGIVKNEPSYYLVKTEHSIDDVVEKVKTTLGIDPVEAAPR